MNEFPYGAVQLTGGPIKQHFDRIHAHYLALDNDRLLKVFRERAGLPAPGPDMGGWYDTDGFVPGLTLGQYISGLARFGAATGDKAAHAKVARLVSGFGEFIRRADNPYAGPNAQAQWAAYVMDKYVVGLVDAFQLSGVEEAKHLLPVTIDKCLPYISPVSRDRIGKKNPPYKTENAAPGELATVRRRWKAGDTIDMVVPQPLRTLSIDTKNPNLAALVRGAVMYVGLNPWDGIEEQSIDLPGSLSPLSESRQAYRTEIAGRDVVFVPYFTIDTERYHTYFKIA
jgi:DUF1680 family protein